MTSCTCQRLIINMIICLLFSWQMILSNRDWGWFTWPMLSIAISNAAPRCSSLAWSSSSTRCRVSSLPSICPFDVSYGLFFQIISAFLHDKKISLLLPCRRINRAPPLPENTMSHREHFPSLMTSISIHSNIKHPKGNLATVMLHQGFFSPLSTSTEITQPEKSAQNDILCTSARCQSAHLPLRHKKALFSTAGLVDTRIIESNCPIFVAAGESVYETQPGGWKGERKHKSTCTHGCQKRKSCVRMCHFKEGWWAGRSSQAGGEELAEQVWRLQRSQLLFCLAAVQRSWQIKLKLNHSKCELLQ